MKHKQSKVFLSAAAALSISLNLIMPYQVFAAEESVNSENAGEELIINDTSQSQTVESNEFTVDLENGNTDSESEQTTDITITEETDEAEVSETDGSITDSNVQTENVNVVEDSKDLMENMQDGSKSTENNSGELSSVFYSSEFETKVRNGLITLVNYNGSRSVVNIPSNIQSIGSAAFRDNKSITEVNINAKCQAMPLSQ